MKQVVIVIVVVVVLIFLGLGLTLGLPLLLMVFNQTQSTLDAEIANMTSNTKVQYIDDSDDYDYDEDYDDYTTGSESNKITVGGITLSYDENWTQNNLDIDGTTYRALTSKNNDVVLVCAASDYIDGDYDCKQENGRQELYNYFISYYMSQGANITEKSGEFQQISDNIYYGYFDLNALEQSGLYGRSIIVIDTQKNKLGTLMAYYDDEPTFLQDIEIKDILRTIEL